MWSNVKKLKLKLKLTACDAQLSESLESEIKIEPESIMDSNIIINDIPRLESINDDDFEYNDIGSFQSEKKRHINYNIVSDNPIKDIDYEKNIAMQQLSFEEKQKGKKTTKEWLKKKAKNIFTKSESRKVKMSIEKMGDKKYVHVLQPLQDYAFVAISSIDNKVDLKCFRKSCNVTAFRNKDGKFFINNDQEHSHGPDNEIIRQKIYENKRFERECADVYNDGIYESIINDKKPKKAGILKNWFSCCGKNKEQELEKFENQYINKNNKHTNIPPIHEEKNEIYIKKEFDWNKSNEAMTVNNMSSKTNSTSQANLIENHQVMSHKTIAQKPKYSQADEAFIALQQLKDMGVYDYAKDSVMADNKVEYKNQVNKNISKQGKPNKNKEGKAKSLCLKLIQGKQKQNNPISERQKNSIKNKEKDQKAERDKNINMRRNINDDIYYYYH